MRIALAAVAVLASVSLLSGCSTPEVKSSQTAPTAGASTSVTDNATVKVCAEQQQGQAGLLTPAEIWPSSTYGEGGSRVVSLNGKSCHKGAEALTCNAAFPWVATSPEGLLGEVGVRLWAYAELNGAAGTRTQGLTQSVIVFERADIPGIEVMLQRATGCGLAKDADGVLRGHVGNRQIELVNLGRVQVVLEYTGDWHTDEAVKVHAAAVSAAKAL